MLEGFKSPKQKIKVEDIIEKYPPHFSVEEIVEAELPKARIEERENLADFLNEYFDKEISEKEKSELKKEIAMVKEWEQFKKEQRKEEKENLKEEKLKILEELKEMMDDEFIKEQRTQNFYEHYGQKDIWKFWVGFAAKTLAKTYFDKINKKATKREINNLKDEIKNEYYKKRNAPEPPFPDDPPLRNFYESQREQMEDLSDKDLEFFK